MGRGGREREVGEDCEEREREGGEDNEEREREGGDDLAKDDIEAPGGHSTGCER